MHDVRAVELARNQAAWVVVAHYEGQRGRVRDGHAADEDERYPAIGAELECEFRLL